MTLTDRAKNIIVSPKAEWPVIEAEPTSVKDIYSSYVIPLAAIPAAAGFLGTAIIGIGVPGIGMFRVPFFSGLAIAVLQFALALALVYVVGLVIDSLAPTFGGRKNPLSAFKVAAYSYTPAWLAGVFALIPSVRFLTVLGLYGLYLLYLGLPRLMHCPEDRALGYAAVVVVVAIVLGLVIGATLHAMIGLRVAI
jgi:hypothetical protein